MYDLAYSLDADDRISSVSCQWDDVALVHETPTLFASAILGQQIWEFVSGFETETYLKAALFQARRTKRCFVQSYLMLSSKTEEQYIMCIAPEADDRLTIYHSLASVKWRCRQEFEKLPVSDKSCSICCKPIRQFFRSILRIDDECSRNENRQDYGICNACRTRVGGILESMYKPAIDPICRSDRKDTKPEHFWHTASHDYLDKMKFSGRPVQNVINLSTASGRSVDPTQVRNGPRFLQK